MKFSIVTPNYNYGRFLRKALQSVFDQTSSPDVSIEHIVIDGGSTDDSVSILKDWDAFARGTAAAKAGLQSGDIIVALGEYEVASFSDLRQALRHFSAGDTATVSVYRNGETIELSITFDEARPDNAS